MGTIVATGERGSLPGTRAAQVAALVWTRRQTLRSRDTPATPINPITYHLPFSLPLPLPLSFFLYISLSLSISVPFSLSFSVCFSLSLFFPFLSFFDFYSSHVTTLITETSLASKTWNPD